jgi:3-oxoacyl-[acyl-carrier-protein] synthase-1
MPDSPVYFHGSGLHTALGSDPQHNLRGLREGGVRPTAVTIDLTEQSLSTGFYKVADLDLDLTEARLYRMVDQVVMQAVESTGYREQELAETHLFVGSTSFDISTVEDVILRQDLPEGFDPPQLTPMDTIARHIRNRFRLGGDAYSFNTACTASANALLYACHQIRHGLIGRALVVGLEFFNQLCLLGFHSLGLISDSSFRPFTAARNGLLLGEGCSALIVSNERSGRINGVRFLGGSSLCDTHSMTTTRVDGSRIAQVMREALADARREPDDMQVIKGHGTATPTADDSESSGIHSIFDHCPPLVLLKPYLGHTLGACGLNETVLFLQCLGDGWMPGVPYSTPSDPELNVRILERSMRVEPGAFMLNAFGFGGNNASMILGNTED